MEWKLFTFTVYFLDAISISTISCARVSVCHGSFMVDSPVRDIFEFLIGLDTMDTYGIGHSWLIHLSGTFLNF